MWGDCRSRPRSRSFQAAARDVRVNKENAALYGVLGCIEGLEVAAKVLREADAALQALLTPAA